MPIKTSTLDDCCPFYGIELDSKTLARLRPRPSTFSPSPPPPRATFASTPVVKCSSSRSMLSKPVVSIKVGTAQMTSTNDLLANFNSCARLVKMKGAEVFDCLGFFGGGSS